MISSKLQYIQKSFLAILPLLPFKALTFLGVFFTYFQILKDEPDLMGIKAAERSLVYGNNPCQHNNNYCSHLCLFTPSGAKCSCPLGMELDKDEKRCIGNFYIQFKTSLIFAINIIVLSYNRRSAQINHKMLLLEVWSYCDNWASKSSYLCMWRDFISFACK